MAAVSSPSSVCTSCGGRLEVVMDLERVRETVTKESMAKSRNRGVWKYQQMLPVISSDAIVSLGEGNTSLLRSNMLAEILGLRRLYIKDETSNPSGAFIDRGTTVDVSRAKALGFKAAACGWSGNLASSLAAYCARGGLRSRAYLPGQIDLGKLYQTVAYGAEIVPCTSRQEALEQLRENQNEFYPVTASNPFFLEGIKTTGIEIVDQLGWRPPDWIVVPMGNGSHITMLHKGLRELEEIGLVSSLRTKLVGVQVEGCSPIADMIRPSTRKRANIDCSFARDIAIESPAMAEEAAEAIKRTGGDVAVVSEKEILDAVKLLAKNEGIFAEPASASTVAGLWKLVEVGTIVRSDTIVCAITGTGLKDPTMARKMAAKNRVARQMISKYEPAAVSRRIGDTKMAILDTLQEGESYGYGLRKKVIDRTGKNLSLVSIYQHLLELQDLGLIAVERQERSPERRIRVFYGLTEKGMEFMRAQISSSVPRG
jgi:threonine synthase